jgi:phosphoglycolate phosphatase
LTESGPETDRRSSRFHRALTPSQHGRGLLDAVRGRRDKLIMLDFDGVIADSLDDQTRAFVSTLSAHGIHELATQAVFLDLTEGNWFDAAAAAGLPPQVLLDVEEAFVAAPCPELFPGMPEVIERLAEAYPVVVITSSRTAAVEAILDAHAVRGVAQVLGGDVETSKVKKIRSVRRRHGDGVPAWYVCDTVGDVVEARTAGATPVGVTWGWHGEERLLRADPERLVHRPADLLELF